VVTLFPEFFASPLEVSLVGKARDEGLVDIDLVDLRDHGIGRYRRVDDAPFGGGAGMVMMVEPLFAALEPLQDTRRILLTPAGRPLTQEMLDDWARLPALRTIGPGCLRSR
jgi:tRNA (guanine37-N1)-methyltransferase